MCLVMKISHRAHKGTILIVNDKLLRVNENNELTQNETNIFSVCGNVSFYLFINNLPLIINNYKCALCETVQ